MSAQKNNSSLSNADQMIADLWNSKQNVTDSKVAFVQDECRAILQSHIDAQGDLRKEAHVTLNWIFGLIGLTLSFGVKLIDQEKAFSEQRWWLLVPVICVCLTAMWAGFILFKNALKTEDSIGIGNEPSTLLKSSVFAYDLQWMRLAEIASWQERINQNINRNARMGDAINDSRALLIATPFVFAFCMFAFWAISLILRIAISGV